MWTTIVRSSTSGNGPRNDLYSEIPMHAQLRAIIEGHLKRDAYRVGDHLPGEEQFRERFSVSRPTVRHALADLEADA
jgi:DNA-binding GntR family transcriptional regulator